MPPRRCRSAPLPYVPSAVVDRCDFVLRYGDANQHRCYGFCHGPKQASRLWFHRYVAGRAPEVGATIGLYDPKAIRDELNSWRVVAHGLTQTSHGSLAALGAPQFFVPVIDHATDISPTSPSWPGTLPQIVKSRDCSSPAR
jgi:hypothetical protein